MGKEKYLLMWSLLLSLFSLLEECLQSFSSFLRGGSGNSQALAMMGSTHTGCIANIRPGSCLPFWRAQEIAHGCSLSMKRFSAVTRNRQHIATTMNIL